ncbi:hypothetical protein VHUM_03760 [Vanrija humicola]|uniref:DNA endonuclease activator Ctp1 C-terminal domain-containing protein n=1 Tax=Vanrija humicola TaxID=5417 RepID=A0A7D8UZJ8_VANHU|nr:hypothetical protein VHUM_03760 [Vanrija humicola]
MEGLSPAEKAAELRKIAKLPASERRDLYAEYKGSGRYMPPEAIHRGVADEYEIDPEKNDGVAHQFDAVVRGRDARKRMHGGDCECCRDYYEAVGPLPVFNAGPVWKDAEEDDEVDSPTKRQRQLEDHQNRISRHREVWRKPPTPPDFWKIGFPSTQEVEDVNARADKMVADREAEIRRQTA